MTGPAASETILFYDGVCGLCNRLNRFVIARDFGGKFRFSALQGPFARRILGRYGKDPGDLDTFYLLENYELPSERLLAKSRAGLRVLDRIGGIWRLSRAIAWLPTTWLDAGYDLIAKTRYSIFGKTETCRVPSPEDRARFIDYE
jgi:predicted DCC family thiol-disulfide oxidoreductase YuxK